MGISTPPNFPDDFAKKRGDVMGGLGSGRPRSGRRKVEDCWSLDVNQLRLGGYLRPGCTAERRWTRGGEEIACGRRVAKLYRAGRYFLCRHCYRLPYASQSQDVLGRLQRRAIKARRRLGGDPGTASEFPPRPKGMWRRTYERLCEQAVEAKERADDALLPFLARLLEQTGHLETNPFKGNRSFRK
jgi:hypothetical protein